MSPLLYACVITGLGISNSRQGKEREVLLHKILRVAHSVAQITAKAAQNSPFRCSTMYRKLLICIRSGYYLANFKTAGFNRSPTPPFFEYNWQQLLAGRLVTILGSIAAFWCVLSPNCHQNFRVSRPPPSLNRDFYAYNAWLQRLLNIQATSGLSPYQRLARSDAMQQCDAA